MSLLATSIQRPSLAFQASRPVSRPATRSVRVVAKGTGPGLGNSDPQKVKEQKDEKVRRVADVLKYSVFDRLRFHPSDSALQFHIVEKRRVG